MNKPCINCEGNGKSVGSYHNIHESARYILCPNCGTTSGVYPTEKEAWDEWNNTYIGESKAIAVDADREMIGDDSVFFDSDIGNK